MALELGAALVSLPLLSLSEGADWWVGGRAMTSCSCVSPCPCRSNLPPAPNSFCESSEFADFSDGFYGDVSLAGVRFVMTQRNFSPDSWRVLYVDPQATPRQQGALILLLAQMGYEHFLAVKLRPIQFDLLDGGSTYSVEVAGTLAMSSTRQVDGLTGRPKPVKALDMWGDTITYAANQRHFYHDRSVGKNWIWPRGQSNHKTFTTSRRQYQEDRIGWRKWDGSGEKVWICSHCNR